MGPNSDQTQLTNDQETGERSDGSARQPGLVLVFSRDKARLVPHTLQPSGLSFVGRNDFANAVQDDDRVSRQHVAVRVVEAGFEVSDPGSRNGTFVDGVRLEAPIVVNEGAVIRLGRSLAILVADLRSFSPPRPLEEGDAIVGPRLRLAWEELRAIGRAGEHVLILGESGSGKERAAAVFHEALGKVGPFVAVNCSTIPIGVAERLLFGARRGAYSGADKDAVGYLQAADGGTLFLDEIAELDLEVQAKLLRAIEAREILPLGASHPVRVNVRICAATHTDLRTLVSRGRFREDLYFRLGRPSVRLPPLRERREEIPWLIARELGSVRPRVELVEACLVRPWPGNVRELRSEIRQAALRAKQRDRDEVTSSDLDEVAGTSFEAPDAPNREGPQPLVVRHRAVSPEDEQIRAALAEAKGNVTSAARALGIHRTQLRRWVEKNEGR